LQLLTYPLRLRFLELLEHPLLSYFLSSLAFL
jgi:hypothetical protein